MEFLSPESVKLTIALLALAATVVTWLFNERRKRAWEEYVRKEDNYKKLLSVLRGFYVTTQDKALKQDFIDQLNQCWLYCPDDVIRKAYAFLDTVKVDAQSTDDAPEIACGQLVAAIRQDMLSRRLVKKTELTGKDFRHFRPT